MSPPGRIAEFGAGFRTAILERRLRLLFGLTGAQALVNGALNVLIVALALDLLDMGEAGPGLLISVAGLGAIFGALPAALLVGRRLSPAVGIGMLAWGLPVALIGAWPEQIVALLALATLGAGDVVGFVASQTLIQRLTGEEKLARVFGVLGSLTIAIVGVGGILGSVLIAELGIRGALGATGAFMSLVALLFWRRLMRLDAELRPRTAGAPVDPATPPSPGILLPGVEPPVRDTSNHGP